MFPLFSGLFPVFFQPYSGIIREKGRKNTGNRPEISGNIFRKKSGILSFKVCPQNGRVQNFGHLDLSPGCAEQKSGSIWSSTWLFNFLRSTLWGTKKHGFNIQIKIIGQKFWAQARPGVSINNNDMHLFMLGACVRFERRPSWTKPSHFAFLVICSHENKLQV